MSEERIAKLESNVRMILAILIGGEIGSWFFPS